MVYAAFNIKQALPLACCRCGDGLRRRAGPVGSEAVPKIVEGSCQLNSSSNAYKACRAATRNERDS